MNDSVTETLNSYSCTSLYSHCIISSSPFSSLVYNSNFVRYILGSSESVCHLSTFPALVCSPLIINRITMTLCVSIVILSHFISWSLMTSPPSFSYRYLNSFPLFFLLSESLCMLWPNSNVTFYV